MYFKFAEELFLGKYELETLQNSLDFNGFRLFLLQNSLDYGLIKNNKDNTWDNGLVEQGTNVGTIKHKLLKAIDKGGEFIYKEATDNISIPDDNKWYWIKIKHQYSISEIGEVSIDINGNLTGVGTNFLTNLRGQPDFPTKIKFINATNNLLEYEVLEVIDNTNAILQGNFVLAESNLQYTIIGTFTPGKVIPNSDKSPYQYDGCLMTFVLETIINTPPTISTLNIDYEFYVARVRRNGANLEIEDKRSLYIYKTRADYDLKNILKPISFSAVANIGIESIKFDNALTPQDKNIVYMGWNFRSSNWSVNTNINQVTLNAGEGGKFKTVNDFTNGDFDGYKIYTKDGSYSLIKSSIKLGGQINLILDTLDYQKYSVDSTQELIISPNAEEIEFLFTPELTHNIELPLHQFNFSITERIGKCHIIVYRTTGASYNIQYRFKNLNEYSQWFQIPSDLINGYYDENQFDISGNLNITPSRTTYTSLPVIPIFPVTTNGFITLILNPAAYGYFNLGDVLGVAYFNPTNNKKDLYIGTHKQHQIFGGSLSLTSDLIIELKKTLVDDVTSIRNGNKFWIQIKTHFTLNTFNIIFVQDYVTGPTYTTIYQLTADDISSIISSAEGINFYFEYDGSDWIVSRINETEFILKANTARDDSKHYMGEVGEIPYYTNWNKTTNANNEPGFYYKDNFGVVHLGGNIHPAAYATLRVFDLPTGYIPLLNRFFLISISNTTGWDGAAIFRVNIDGQSSGTPGHVNVQNLNGPPFDGGSGIEFSLDGISFEVD